MSKRFHELPAAGALDGTEPTNIERLSASIALTAATISFAAADNSINDSGGGLIAAGFVAGKSINVTGAVDGANNLYSARITVTGLTASKMIIAAPEGDAIVDGAAGPSITIAQWDSKRTTLQDIADLAGGGDASAVTYTPTTLADWNSSADPGNAHDAFDQLAERVKDLETASPAAPDASVVTYAPADNTDWTGSTDPGDVDQALDQLAMRVKDVEGSGTGDVGGPASAVNNSIAVFDGTTGKLIKDGGKTIAELSTYSVGFFFTTTPSASEVLLLHTFAEAVTFPDELAGSVGDIGTNPTSSFVLDVQKNGSSVGTVTISTGGAFTFVTTGGAVAFAVGDQLKVVGPGSADATAANASITFLGAK